MDSAGCFSKLGTPVSAVCPFGVLHNQAMVPLAYFGIKSSAFSMAIDLIIVFLVVVYFALIYWTFTDARRRIEDPLLIGCATAAALFPFVGPVVYVILRPPEYLEDVRERELEMQAAEARLGELDYGLCPHCDYRIERDFLRCPSCLRKLKERCASCGRPLDQSWTICPYCEAEVAGASPPRSRRRRSSRAEEAAPARAPEVSRRPVSRRRLEEPETSISDPSLNGEDLLADAPGYGLGAETAMETPDLFGETVESDQLALSEPDDDATSAGASDLMPPAPRTRRRSSRPRPTS